MIELSGRAFSRAWLAVQLAASDDDARPVLYRAVHIEEYPDGVPHAPRGVFMAVDHRRHIDPSEDIALDAVGDTLDAIDDGEVNE